MKATEFLREVDRIIAGIEFQHCCRVGCHHCCSEPVYALHLEVDDIVEALTDTQKKAVKQRLKKWITKVKDLLVLNMSDTIEWRKREATCPLLEDGLCMVYQHRPYSCREFYAIDNPHNCMMPNRGHQQFAKFNPALMFTPLAKLKAANKTLVIDNLGVLLAERLLGIKLKSGSRQVG